MAYPPQQGPYGGQQAPQGQQPYGGYPQQQTGPYGGGYGGPPPRKNTAPLIATMIFVLALLAGLGITGFVAPGFFLGDDDKGGGSASGGSGGDGGPGGGGGDVALRRFADDLVAAANDRDKSALSGFACDDARPGVRQATDDIDDTDGAELNEIKEDADSAVIVVDITYQGKTAPFAATAAKDGDDWCWQDFAPGTGGSSGGGSGSDDSDDSDGPAAGPGGDGGGEEEAEAFAKEFLDAVNAKDADTANGMYCPSSAKGIVDYAIMKDAKLAVESTSARGGLLTVTLSGTLDGEPLSRGKVTVELKGSSAPCVFTFSVVG